jgi:hypothetical protein
MRRRHDDWINATHILKAAGFDKPARTRILEREVQKENHEKVQGGYGKYQGLWKVKDTYTQYSVDKIKVLGYHWNRVKLWRNEIMSMRNFVQFSNLSQGISAPLPPRNIPQISQRYQKNQQYQSGEAVSMHLFLKWACC